MSSHATTDRAGLPGALVGAAPTLATPPDADTLVLIADVLTWAGAVEDWLNAARTALIDRGVVVAP